jgi:hypothetical protein
MASVIYRCPTKAVKVQVWFDERTNDRETYISIRCPACARVHLVNPATGKTPADEYARHFNRCPSAAAGLIAVISAKCSSTKVPCHTRHRINRNNWLEEKGSLGPSERAHRSRMHQRTMSHHLVKSRAALGSRHLASIEIEHEEPTCRREISVPTLRIDLANKTRQICKTQCGDFF